MRYKNYVLSLLFRRKWEYLGGKTLLPMKSHIAEFKTSSALGTQKYVFSFTTGALLLQESLNLATLFLELKDWELVRDTVIKNNTLQTGTVKSSVRLCQELCSRLKTLGDTELRLLVEGSIQEQGYMLWLAVCRRYTFVRDFAVEVLRGKLLDLDTELKKEDFEVFFNQKAEWHEELVRIKPATRAKARQTIFRML